MGTKKLIEKSHLGNFILWKFFSKLLASIQSIDSSDALSIRLIQNYLCPLSYLCYLRRKVSLQLLQYFRFIQRLYQEAQLIPLISLWLSDFSFKRHRMYLCRFWYIFYWPFKNSMCVKLWAQHVTHIKIRYYFSLTNPL